MLQLVRTGIRQSCSHILVLFWENNAKAKTPFSIGSSIKTKIPSGDSLQANETKVKSKIKAQT